MTMRRVLWSLAAAVFVVVGAGGAALFFWGGKPGAEVAGLRGEVEWESEVQLFGTVIIAADEDHVVVRSSPLGVGVDVLAIDLNTGEEVLRDRAHFVSGIGLQDGRVVYVHEDSGNVISHGLADGDRWEQSDTKTWSAVATPNGVVVRGPDQRDVRVLDAMTGEQRWARVGAGRVMNVDASTVLLYVDDGLVAYGIESGEELWRVPTSSGRVISRGRPSELATVVVVQEEASLVGYAPRSGEVLWEHPLDTGDSSSGFFHAAEENLVFECVAGTTWFTVRTIDDRTGEILATVDHDPQASLVGYNGTAFVVALGGQPEGCITWQHEPSLGSLEGYGLRDGGRRWSVEFEAVDLSQPASRGPDDRPGAGLRTDVIQWRDPQDDSGGGYFFATTGEAIVSPEYAETIENADAIDVVAGQIATTELTDETATVTLPDLELTISRPNGRDGTTTVYAVRGGLLVLAGRSLVLVR